MKTPSILALPAPSLARHLARTIDGRSLTGIPGGWSTPISRKPFRPTKTRTPAWKRMSPRTRQQFQAELSHCRGHIHCINSPHPDTTLWMVAFGNDSIEDVYDATELRLSAVWRNDRLNGLHLHLDAQEPDGVDVQGVPIALLPALCDALRTFASEWQRNGIKLTKGQPLAHILAP